MRKSHKKSMTPPKIRRLATHIAVHSSLIFSSLPIMNVQAATEVQNPGLGTVVQGMQIAGQLYMQYLQSMPQPGPCDSLNPAAEIIPSQYFPGCPIFRAQSAFPNGACENIKDPQTYAQGDSCRAKAIQYVQTLDNLLSEAQNVTPAGYTPVGTRSQAPQIVSNVKGVQCLEQSRTNVMTSIEDRLNNLKALANRIKKETQMFKEQNKAMLDEMSNIAQELYGSKAGDGKVGVDERTSNKEERDFSKFFGASCRNIIGSGKLMNASQGLVGIQDGMKEVNSKALDYDYNKASYQNQLNDKIAEIQAEISKRGIGPWISEAIKENSSATSGFMSVDLKAAKEISNFMTDYTRVKGEVTEVLGNDNDIFKLPDVGSLSSTFTADMQEFRTGAKVFFKKKFINQCVTMADKGVGLEINQILKALEYPATSGFGDALPKYKLALQNILQADIYMDEKLLRIKALDQQFGGTVVVNYQDSNAGYVKEPPYALFQKTVAACEAKYDEDDTFSTSGSQGVGSAAKSMAKKIEIAERKIKELENMSRTFIPTIMQKMQDQLANCSGSDYKAETCKEDGAAFNPQTQNFCLAHANKCFSQTQSCVTQADKLITERKTNLQSKAKVYNTNVANLIARQEKILTQIRDQVLADAEYLKKYFPGSTWQFPKDLFIKMPEEMMVDSFGVKIRGGNDFDLKYMDALPQQIEETLVKTLEEQREKVDQQVQDYIAKQKEAMEENKNKWEELRATCESNQKAFEQQYAQQQQQMAQKAQEANQQKQEHCSKVDKILSSNPLGLCGKPGDLFEDSSRVAASLDSETADLVNQANALCDQAQSEGIVGTEKDDGDSEKTDSSKKNTIATYCKMYPKDTRKKIIERFTKTLPESQRSKVKKYLESSDQDISHLSGMNDSEKENIVEFGTSINPKSAQSSMAEFSAFFGKVNGYEKQEDKDKAMTRAKEMQDALLSEAELPMELAMTKSNIADYNTSSYRDKHTGDLSYCDLLKLSAAAEAIKKSSPPSSDNVSSEKTKLTKAYTEKLESMSQALGAPMDRSIASSKAKQLEEDFSRLGENYNGACNGSSDLGRSNFLQNFDANILGNSNGLNGLQQPVFGK